MAHASAGRHPELRRNTPLDRLRRWRATRRVTPLWTVGAIVAALLVALPLVSIAGIATGGHLDVWSHLAATVLPIGLTHTAVLLTGAAIVTAIVGTGCAWLVTMYRFPGRVVLDHLLVLPLAVPTYITAYAYADAFDYAGPLQTSLRTLFGVAPGHGNVFPEIRSLPGAVFVMSAVLYPYVYLAARASFVQQSVCALEVARTLGASAAGAFWRVALPMARPAIIAGVALVLMECMNDLGAVQHLGVQTLSASITATWLQRGSLAGAAQLSLVAMLVIFAIIAMERRARGAALTHATTARQRAIPFETIEGWRGYAALLIGAVPVVTGFVIPAGIIGWHASANAQMAVDGDFLAAARNSILLSAIVASLTVIVALIVAYARRLEPGALTASAADVAAIGYAFPGTVLAIGVLIPLAAFDNAIDARMRDVFGVSTGLILSGSLAAVSLALLIRFLAVAMGPLVTGLARVSPNIDAAARSLGAGPMAVLARVHVRLILPAVGAAALMVFVDTMKELPATLLLRPFNFETLATQVYSLAALERFEEGCLGAFAIILMGLLPVVLLHRAVASGRAGQ